MSILGDMEAGRPCRQAEMSQCLQIPMRDAFFGVRQERGTLKAVQ